MVCFLIKQRDILIMKNNTVLVTGGLGFIGSWLVKLLIKKNFKVINFDSITYAASELNLKEFENCSNYTFVKGDIRNSMELRGLFKKFNFDGVFHLAAETHVDRSIKNPKEFLETNIIGTYELLKVSKKYLNLDKDNNFKFIHISTDEVFGSLKDREQSNEEAKYFPNSPYSASKASSDHLVRSWNITYGLPTIICHCTNNYGPFQFPEKLIPVIILNILKNKDIPVYGNGKNVRDWIFVNDHCEALLDIFYNGKIGAEYNIGAQTQLTNLEMINKIFHIMKDLKIISENHKLKIKYVDDRLGHDFVYGLDTSKINKEVGWFPKTSLNEGLTKTIRWFYKNQLFWTK